MANGKRGKKHTTSMENFLQDVARESDAAQGMAARPGRDLRTAEWAKPLRDPENPWMLELAIQMVWFARNDDRLVDNSWDYERFSQALQKENLPLPEGMTIEKAVDQVQDILRKVGSRKPKHRGGKDDPSIPEDAGWYELNVGRPLHQKRTRLDVGAQALDAPFRDGAGSSQAVDVRAGGANYYDTLDGSEPLRRVILHTDLRGLSDRAQREVDHADARATGAELSVQARKDLQRERDLWATIGSFCDSLQKQTSGQSQNIDDVLSLLSDEAAAARANGRSLTENPNLRNAVSAAAPKRVDDRGFYKDVAYAIVQFVFAGFGALEAQVLFQVLLANAPVTLDEIGSRSALPTSIIVPVLDKFSGDGLLKVADDVVQPVPTHPQYWQFMRALASGPVLAKRLVPRLRAARIDTVVVHGSFARLAAGKLRRVPAEIDLAVVSDMTMQDAAVLAEELDSRVGLEVSLRPYPQEQWNSPSGLLETILQEDHFFLGGVR